MRDPEIHCLTADDFANLTPWAQGYMCTLHGDDPSRPHIPAKPKPAPRGKNTKAQFTAGAIAALRYLARTTGTQTVASE